MGFIIRILTPTRWDQFYLRSFVTCIMLVSPAESARNSLELFCCVIGTTQRKELGLMVYNCSCLALDLHRVFSFYRQLHQREYIPSIWSKRVTALYGKQDALELQLNTTQATAYLSVRDQCFVTRFITS